MSCPSQTTQLAEFHNVILTTQLVEFLVSSNSPASPVHHWAINSPEDFVLKDTKTMLVLFREYSISDINCVHLGRFVFKYIMMFLAVINMSEYVRRQTNRC